MSIIAFIGSSRLRDIILKIAAYYEKQGNVCIMSHIFSNYDLYELTDREESNAISNGHKRIDMADTVILVKVNDHIGKSSLEEKEYALSKNKQFEEISINIDQYPKGETINEWKYSLTIDRYVQDEHDENYDIYKREDKKLEEWIYDEATYTFYRFYLNEIGWVVKTITDTTVMDDPTETCPTYHFVQITASKVKDEGGYIDEYRTDGR